MGLDITAYRQIQPIGTVYDQEDYEDTYNWENTVWIYPAYILKPEFPQQIKGHFLRPAGVYRYEEEYKFRAGSYGGYNNWRDELSRYMLGVPAKEVWDHPKLYKDKPFYLLINFSDCEGIICGESAEKLRQDFAEYEERAAEHHDSYWFSLYRDWAKAFEFAADGGFVDFH